MSTFNPNSPAPNRKDDRTELARHQDKDAESNPRPPREGANADSTDDLRHEAGAAELIVEGEEDEAAGDVEGDEVEDESEVEQS